VIVTEEEAKTKRCQESFPAAEGLTTGGYTESVPFPPNVVSYNAAGSYARQTAPSMCIGSACMAWRWDRYYDDDGEERIVTGQGQKPCGYCGKAGSTEPRKARP
jgi:hypothetical protein